eukprot:6337662-Heterocapsa_arctica.AAC.1
MSRPGGRRRGPGAAAAGRAVVSSRFVAAGVVHLAVWLVAASVALFTRGGLRLRMRHLQLAVAQSRGA